MDQIGKIIRLTSFGLGVILGEGEGAEAYPFTFDKLAGYRGEYVKELKPKGFRRGAIVLFRLDSVGRVAHIRLPTFQE